MTFEYITLMKRTKPVHNFTETIVHTTSYGPCETITYSWDGKKKQCKKVKGMSRAAKPHVCANDQNLVSEHT